MFDKWYVVPAKQALAEESWFRRTFFVPTSRQVVPLFILPPVSAARNDDDELEFTLIG